MITHWLCSEHRRQDLGGEHRRQWFGQPLSPAQLFPLQTFLFKCVKPSVALGAAIHPNQGNIGAVQICNTISVLQRYTEKRPLLRGISSLLIEKW